MNHTPHPGDALSAYIDGDLTADETRAVSDHLAACADCRAVVSDLERLRTHVRAWADEPAAPAVDLWPGVATRLAPRATSHSMTTGAPAAEPVARLAWYRRRVSLGLPELALAASLVAGLAGALVSQRAVSPARQEGPPPVLAEREPLDAPDAGVATASFADAQYDAAVSDLEKALAKGRGRLDTSTIAIVEQNLQIIDRAIEQAREALAADPANSYLSGHLVETRRRKLDLLRRATALTTEMN